MKNSFKSLVLLMLLIFSYNQIISQVQRTEIDEKYKWDLSGLFTSDEDWNSAKDQLTKKLDKVEQFRGKILSSPESLLEVLKYGSEINKEASRLYIYASMNSDLDTRNMKYSGMKKELSQIYTDFGAKASYIEPEILTADWALIESYINKAPELKDYEMSLKELFRQKEHTLSEAEEKIMAFAGLATGNSSSTYNTFKNAEMPNPSVTLSNGEEVVLNSAGYEKYRAAANREDRHRVFETYWSNFKKFEATFGELLYGQVKSMLFYANSRKYESSLESALYPNAIPTDVYRSLIKNVNDNLPAFHRYLKLKKRMMKLDSLKYLDLYAPAVKGVDLKYTYDEAQEIILESLKPLGKEYVATVKKAFDERWIDVYPTTGKRSGAYSNGADYDGHPYILLNYNDLYEDVSTTSHELGHTMQSYFSNKTQPYPKADYGIFVAEVASTFNEILLFEHMKNKIKDDDVKLSLLMNRLNGFKGTLFRQTQFAEFELAIHEAAKKGQPLTGEYLSKTYLDIVKKYYGHDKEICHVDDYIEMEWAFIPHFYYNFYVYQYSTSFVASNTLAEGVMNKEKDALDKYITFLSAGGSDYQIELLKNAGVDMTSSESFSKTIKAMNDIMDEIEKILDKKGM